MSFNMAMTVIGWIGVIIIQGSTIPAIYLAATSQGLPPFYMIAMIWAGLGMFTAKAVADKATIYIAANASGFLLQTVMMGFLIYDAYYK
jgi:hypothetical protein